MNDLVPVIDQLKSADWLVRIPIMLLLAIVIVAVDAVILLPTFRRLRSGAASTTPQISPGIRALCSFHKVPRSAVIATAFLSGAAFVFSAILLQMPPYMVTLYMLIPWIPALVIETSYSYKRYGALAVFAIILA